MTTRDIINLQLQEEILEESLIKLNKGDILRVLNILDHGNDLRKSVPTGLMKTRKTYKTIILESIKRYSKILNIPTKIKGFIIKPKDSHIIKIGAGSGVFSVYIKVYGNDGLEEYKKEFDKYVNKYFKLLQLTANRFRKVTKMDMADTGPEYEKKLILDVVFIGKSEPDGLMKDESEKLVDYIAQTLSEIATL